MYSLGVSSKIIHLIRNFYSTATFRVRSSNNALSTSIPISEGVLQGETLSPFLFRLFISDVEENFRFNGAVGLSIDGWNDVLLLLYADDLIILGDSEIDLARKLRLLEQYTSLNKLTVNVNKTKIMCFSRGGFNKKTLRFIFNGEDIEVVNKFTYLGVTFASSSLFLEMSKNSNIKAKQAIGTVMATLSKSKAVTWETRAQLYNSIVLSILLYCVQVWGLRYSDVLERVQVFFYKRLLLLPRSTPDCYLRLETGTVKLKWLIFKSCLGWLLKLLQMPDGRLPKLCFERNMQLHQGADPRFNWCTQLRYFFQEIDCLDVWSSIDVMSLKRQYTLLLDKYREKLLCGDLDAFAGTLYSGLSNIPYVATNSNYLHLSVPISVTRLLSQIRLCNRLYVKISFNGNYYVVNTTELCTLCNLNKPETLDHIFFECPIYQGLRVLLPIGMASIVDVWTFIYTISLKNAKLLYGFVTGVLKLRAFILNE